eukprot:m.262612 g.262612  ORF g.262612 m.262612 type:complete len:1005 (+) comp16222_c1_seq36:2220-5234(+)
MSWENEVFETHLKAALEDVKKILDTTRHPVHPAEARHTYDDKYSLAELATNAALVSLMNTFTEISPEFPNEMMAIKAKAEALKKPVTLAFSAIEKCSFVSTEIRQQESETAEEETCTTTLMGSLASMVTTKTVHTAPEHKWKLDLETKLQAYIGNDASTAVTLFHWEGTDDVITPGVNGQEPQQPYPLHHIYEPVCLDVTWFLAQITHDTSTTRATNFIEYCYNFHINRDKKSCRTPNRNEDIKKAQETLEALDNFVISVLTTLESQWEPVIYKMRNLKVSDFNSEEMFTPVKALFFMEKATENEYGTTFEKDFPAFADNHRKKLKEFVSTVVEHVKEHNTSLNESSMVHFSFMALHIKEIKEQYFLVLTELKNMVYNELNQAIGKHLVAKDFTDYMLFHNSKLFKPQFRPRAFCYNIQDGDSSPEGMISIESAEAGEGMESIFTFSSKSCYQDPMKFALSAAANVSYTGNHYVHAYALTNFAEMEPPHVNLVSRSRQFSSFILMVGTVGGAGQFLPSEAVILRNKDEVVIPLLLETLPSAKEFKKAIESLSPEMRQFSQAIRSMQLAGSLFAVCVLQIKPQMEKVLNLPSGSLKKHIKLTENLMDLFLTYQIPTDLFKYDGPSEARDNEKIDAVNGHVEKLLAIIQAEKDTELINIVNEKKKEELSKNVVSEQMQQRLRHPSVYREVDNVKGVMYQNIDSVLERGEALDFLADKSESLSASSMSFKKAAKTLKRQKGWGMNFYSRKSSPSSSPQQSAPIVELGLQRETIGRKRDDSELDELEKHVAVLKELSISIGSELEDQNELLDCLGEPQAGDDDTRSGNRAENTKEKKQTEKKKTKSSTHNLEGLAPVSGVSSLPDYAKLPTQLENRFEGLDFDIDIRPTTIKTQETWTRKAQKGLLSKHKVSSLARADQRDEKQKAFDLIDALTLSGTVVYEKTDFHVVMAATHSFTETLIDTVTLDNINPIDKVEQSTLIMASSIHNVQPKELVQSSERDRIIPTLC